MNKIDSTNKQLEKFKLELEHPEFQLENILIQSDGDAQIIIGMRFFRPNNSMQKYFFEQQNAYLKDRKHYVDIAQDLIKNELESLNKIIDGIIEFENALFHGKIPHIPTALSKKHHEMQLEEYSY